MASKSPLRRLAGSIRRELSPSQRPLFWSGLFLAIVIVIVMWREILMGGMLLADDIWVSDLLNNNVPPRAFLGQAIRDGHFPLWMPGSYGGLALVPQGEAAATSPITWLLYVPFHRVAATTMSIALHTWIAGFGMVLAARRFGARALAATAAGVAFMLCGFLIEHMKHMNMHHAAAFLPWMLYSLDRIRESPGTRTALPFAALASLQIAEGHPQMCYIGAFALAPALVYRMFSATRKGPAGRGSYALHLAFALGLAGAITLLLSAAYLWAGYDLYTGSERAAETVNRWDFCTRFGWEWQNILTLGWAHAFGNGANATYNPRYGLFWESWLYAGMVPVFAAFVALLAGIVRAARRSYRKALPVLGWGLLVALSIALMLGKASRVYKFAFYFVPGMTWFRFPQRFALVLELAVLFLAAIGLDAIRRSVENRVGRRAGLFVGLLLLGATAWDMTYFMMGHFFAIPKDVALRPPATVKVLSERAPKEAWRFLPILGPEAHTEAFGQARGWQKWKPYVPQWSILQASTHLNYGLPAVGGYTSLVPEGVGKVLGSHNAIGILGWPRGYWAEKPKDPPSCQKEPLRMNGKCRGAAKCTPHMAKSFGAFNVKFLISPLPLDNCPGWKEVETLKVDPLEVHVFENEHFMPRAYVVDSVVDVPTFQDAATKLQRGEIDPTRRATRVRPKNDGASPGGGASGRASTPFAPSAGAVSVQRTPPGNERPYRACQYVETSPGMRKVACDLDQPGYLIVADTYEKGTEIRVDGARVEPFLAHAIQIGVELPAGHHDVTVEFRPRYRGLVIASVIGWALLAALAIFASIRALVTFTREV